MTIYAIHKEEDKRKLKKFYKRLFDFDKKAKDSNLFGCITLGSLIEKRKDKVFSEVITEGNTCKDNDISEDVLKLIPKTLLNKEIYIPIENGEGNSSNIYTFKSKFGDYKKIVGNNLNIIAPQDIAIILDDYKTEQPGSASVKRIA